MSKKLKEVIRIVYRPERKKADPLDAAARGAEVSGRPLSPWRQRQAEIRKRVGKSLADVAAGTLAKLGTMRPKK